MKNTLRKMMIVSLILMVGVTVFCPAEKPASAQTTGESGPIAVMNVASDLITWQPTVDYASLTLTVEAPSGAILTRTFDAGNIPIISIGELPGDGLYSYELHLTPVLDVETQASLQAVADDPEARNQLGEALTAAGVLPTITSQSGSFTIASGQFIFPVEEKTNETTFSETQTTDGNMINDALHYDDVIVTGSFCVGFDCVDGESFGFDTIKLKENNLQIYFDDTSSTIGFPNNDWRLIANDSTSGGANYFKIVDSTNSKEPFKIMANARTNAFYISSNGRIGFGTNTPVLKLHIADGNTPSVRLDQDGSGGWGTYVWDVAGNEANFFIRDVTGGSRLPFRIRPGAPNSSIDISASGNVGIGTASPGYDLEVENTGQNTTIVAQRTDGATAGLFANASTVQIGSLSNHDIELVVNDTPVITLTGKGEMTLQGSSGVAGEFFAGDSAVQIGSATDNDVQMVVNNTPVITVTGEGDMTLQGSSGATVGLSANANTVQIGSLTDQDLEMMVNNTPVLTVTGQGDMTLLGPNGNVSEFSASSGYTRIGSFTNQDVELVVNDNPVMSLTGEGEMTLQGAVGGATAGMSTNGDTVQIGSRSSHDVEMVVNDTVVMTMTSAGNMTLQGALSEYSDVNVKENFAAVDGSDVLDRLSSIPVMTWNYISDESGVQHMGPMAQDFYAAFELGADDRHIASLDVNGVSLAAIQTLSKITSEQKTQIDELCAENDELSVENNVLKVKVDSLETRLSKLEQAVGNGAGNQSHGLPVWSLVVVVLVVGAMQATPMIYRKMKQAGN